MQKKYEPTKAQADHKKYKARHILLETEDQAKGMIAELKKGGKFDELATKNSKDNGTKDRGGDLDWNVPSVFDPQFADVMVKLEKGKYTETPVRTRFGFHVIQLDDVRQVKFPALAEVRPRPDPDGQRGGHHRGKAAVQGRDPRRRSAFRRGQGGRQAPAGAARGIALRRGARLAVGVVPGGLQRHLRRAARHLRQGLCGGSSEL